MNAAPEPDERATTRPGGANGRRPRKAPEVVILTPIAVPLDQQRRPRAVSALTALLTQWWDQHGRHLAPADHDGADGSSSQDD